MIGFGALDADVLELLLEMRSLKRLGIVNGVHQDGTSALEKMAPYFRKLGKEFLAEDVVFDMGFAKFASSGKLKEFLAA